jgi:MFS family permease
MDISPTDTFHPDAPMPPAPPSVSFGALMVPYAVAFISSMGIMVVELVAGRLIARYVGSSLYTWTSIIGVVLAGIAIGNWIGGRLADRYPAVNSLGVSFGIASLACFMLPLLNSAIGESSIQWDVSWGTRIAAHVFLVFLLPATMLGCIGPQAAKMALDLGRQVGHTLGNVYAWGAFGSIVGTFLTGFFLLGHMGVTAMVTTVGCTMAMVAAMFGVRYLMIRGRVTEGAAQWVSNAENPPA